MNDSRVRRFGEGPLSRASALVYTLLVVELALLLTTLPGLIPLMFLQRDVSNLPLAALCLLPAGPALCAAFYALHHRRLDLTDLTPGAAFWRGYRLNLLPCLKIWVPALAWLTVIAISLGNRAAAGIPTWWAALLLGIALVIVLAELNALVITSLFSFRARDIARLSLHFLVRAKGVTLGNAGLLIGPAGVALLATEAVLALLGSAFALAVLHTSKPMIAAVERDFTAASPTVARLRDASSHAGADREAEAA